VLTFRTPFRPDPHILILSCKFLIFCDICKTIKIGIYFSYILGELNKSQTRESTMVLYVNTDQRKIDFLVSSEIFSFNSMIESCRVFFNELGFSEISSLYIILRELIFNTILNVVNLNNNCEFICTVEVERKGKCTVILAPAERCGDCSCFDWININNDTVTDRENILLNNISDSIEIDLINNMVIVEFSLLTKK